MWGGPQVRAGRPRPACGRWTDQGVGPRTRASAPHRPFLAAVFIHLGGPQGHPDTPLKTRPKLLISLNRPIRVLIALWWPAGPYGHSLTVAAPVSLQI